MSLLAFILLLSSIANATNQTGQKMTDFKINDSVTFLREGQIYAGQIKALNDDHAIVAFLLYPHFVATAKVPYSQLTR